MSKKRLVYIWSLRNAAADRAGQYIDYQGAPRYMMSPLEHLAGLLEQGPLAQAYSLEGILHDDDEGSPRDREKLREYGFACGDGSLWFHPPQLSVQGRTLAGMQRGVPSTYRRLPLDAAGRAEGKRDFERRLLAELTWLRADVVVLDGLLVILDELVRPGAPYHRRIYNIHPGITRQGSAHERRGAWATLDALHGARGEKVVDWTTMQTVPAPTVQRTGASFHHVDNGIDSGEVVADVLATDIDPRDTILELRWNNFNRSLFPALERGLARVAGIEAAVSHAA